MLNALIFLIVYAKMANLAFYTCHHFLTLIMIIIIIKAIFKTERPGTEDAGINR